jgi:hypothetical protein
MLWLSYPVVLAASEHFIEATMTGYSVFSLQVLILVWPIFQNNLTSTHYPKLPHFDLLSWITPLWPTILIYPTLAHYPDLPHFGPLSWITPLWLTILNYPYFDSLSQITLFWLTIPNHPTLTNCPELPHFGPLSWITPLYPIKFVRKLFTTYLVTHQEVESGNSHVLLVITVQVHLWPLSSLYKYTCDPCHHCTSTPVIPVITVQVHLWSLSSLYKYTCDPCHHGTSTPVIPVITVQVHLRSLYTHVHAPAVNLLCRVCIVPPHLSDTTQSYPTPGLSYTFYEG